MSNRKVHVLMVGNSRKSKVWLAFVNQLGVIQYPTKIRNLHTSHQHKKKATDVKPGGGPTSTDSFANGTTASYLDGLYASWVKNPSSVDASWDAFFSGKPRTMSTQPTSHPSGVPPPKNRPISTSQSDQQAAAAAAPAAAPSSDWKYIDDHLTVQAIIRAYQSRGHLAADLDPLGIVAHPQVVTQDGMKRSATRAVLRQHYSYVFGEQYLNTPFKLPKLSTKIGGNEITLPLREIIDRLERVYCGKIGLEYMQMTSLNKTNWIRERFEVPGAINFSPPEKKRIYRRLMASTGFENFLAKKFASEKRFGLEGCDILIPILREIVDRATMNGVEHILIGMAHRGRLNVLTNVCKKPISDLLSQFHGLKATDSGSGDVKYHLGTFTERLNRFTNKMVRLTVVANPSHLEHVNCVLTGRARAEMFYRGDIHGDKVLPIIIHGDASFCGQGVVYETIHMSDLPAYTTHGTIHIVTNNQVGFTTDPRFSRSSRYCTDVARVLNVPILHVNSDCPEANIFCARVANDWRAKFHKDVVIDIVGYRRNGHNEADEPMFTQPLMYQRIKKLKPVLVQYGEKLVKEKVITDAELKDINEKYQKSCEKAWDESKKIKSIKYGDWIDSPWSGFFEGRDRLKVCPTGVSMDVLMRIGQIFSSPPPPEHKFEIHKGIERILRLRAQMVKAKMADWALGEAFAFGTLLKDGIHVRLSGEDVERGTFSHRHHIFHHQTRDQTVYNSLEHLYPDQANYTVTNSSLSECAILGFEHGYSMANPKSVVIWEAQFGDFANTAQTIIDCFISSGESKWVRQSGVVLFLPHSMEGMGPEHSSGRIERFLQLSNDDPDIFPDTSDADFVARQIMESNWIITNLSTPANLFHALRRQVALSFRKPLVNFSPKSLLRHPEARSPFREFNECSEFKRLLPEIGKAARQPECVKKLIFCSGKVYYDLKKERIDHEQDEEVAIVRVEQLCPFPYDLVVEQICLYPNADLLWAQEEHKNQGPWPYVQPRFETTLIKMQTDGRCISYHGRPPSSAPSTGNKVKYYKEYEDFMTSIFGKLTEANVKRLERIKKETQEAAKANAEAEKLAKQHAAEAAKKASEKPDDKGKAGKDVKDKAAAKPAPKNTPKAGDKPKSK